MDELSGITETESTFNILVQVKNENKIFTKENDKIYKYKIILLTIHIKISQLVIT